MKRIANFVLDEKFIDSLVEYHDYVGGNVTHDYYFVSNSQQINFRYIKKQGNRVNVIKENDVLDITCKYDAVFLHSMFTIPINIIPHIDERVKVFWFSWGYDIYSSPFDKPLININLTHSLTREYCQGDICLRIFNCLREIKGYLKKRNSKYYLDAVHRIDYYSGVIDEEYGLLREYIPQFRAEKVDYSYCNISSFPKRDYKLNNHRNIVIGNSTAFENNHLDIFYTLVNTDWTNRKIYVPLSYSPNPRYVRKLKEEGHRLFGENFVALTDFLPYSDYKKILDSCGFAIYGSERQMAMGNIRMSLENGAKVFLYSSSIIFKHYKNCGIKVFSIDEDLKMNNAFQNLSKKDAINNYEIIYANLNEAMMIDKLVKIYDILDLKGVRKDVL